MPGRKKIVAKRKLIVEQPGDAINGRYCSAVVGLANANVNLPESGGPGASQVTRKAAVRRDEKVRFHELLCDMGVRLVRGAGRVKLGRERVAVSMSKSMSKSAHVLNESKLSAMVRSRRRCS